MFVKLMAAVLVALIAYGLQRSGFLRHGTSYYLPHSTQESVLKRALLFRNLFYSIATEHGYPRDEVQKMILYPHEQIADTFRDISQLDQVDKTIQSMLPSTLYEQGEGTPFVYLESFKQSIIATKGTYRHDPRYKTTFVLFPGILSEFLNTQQMFDDVFHAEPKTTPKTTDPLYQLWNKEFEKAQKDAKKFHLTQDKAFSLDKLERVTMNLNQLMEVTTMNDGELSYNLVRFHSPLGSLESLGTLRSSSTTFLTRLDKFFGILSMMKGPIYMMGYSRGGIVALDTLTRAKARLDIHTWGHRLAGVISLAGVLYGTPSADAINVQDHPTKKILDLMVNCTNALDYSYTGDFGSVGHAQEIAANTKLFFDLGLGLANVASEIETDTRMTMEFATAPVIDHWNLARLARSLLMEQFRLHEPVQEYYGNVKTFKILVNAIEEGLRSITTESRLEWWKNNQVPTDVHYYGITGTMMDALHESKHNIQEIMERDVCYDGDSLDFRTSRAFYYDLLRDGKSELSDGQVPVSRALFWPKVAASLNPQQQPFGATLLGIINSPHWPIAMPRIFDDYDSAFPRQVLLKTIAVFIEADLIKAEQENRPWWQLF